MANCPICHAEIKDDFGLVKCAACGAQVLVEFNGEVESQPPPIGEELTGVLLEGFAQATHEVSEEQPEADRPPPPPAVTTSADMSEIADFGNSSTSQGKEGMLRFNLHIGGIDTADIRKEVREALADERFLWDPDQILSQISNGALVIKEVTAVKSALLVQRMRIVSVDISWEQYAIHQV